MRTEMVMPQMGESIAEATVLKWLKGVGDNVEKDETILEISTDKVDSEIPAPASGVLVEIKAGEGDTVPVKEVIAVIDTDGAAAGPPKKAAQKPTEKKAEPKKAPAPSKPTPAAAKPTPPPAPSTPAASGAPASGIPAKVGERFYSPLVRSLAAQHGLSALELARVPGTGEHGRVTKDDLLLYMQHRPADAHFAAASAKPAAPAPGTPRPQYDENGVHFEPMDNMRKKIAAHMVMSKATSPHVYSVAEVDVTNIARWRQMRQRDFQSREGFKLSFTPFFLEATVRALVQFPQVNASVDGNNVVWKRNINLGCAVALGSTGLIVPVIKDADQMNLAGLAKSLLDLAARAREKKLLPDEVQGGTFTVTNPGGFGNIMGYPIISQPQLGILGIGAIKKRPMVVNDAIAIRDIVYLTLSYDHRVVDGALGGQFLQYIAKYLENWDMSRES